MRAQILFYADFLRRQPSLLKDSLASVESLRPASTSSCSGPIEYHQLSKGRPILGIAQNENTYQYKKASAMLQALNSAALLLRKQLPDWRNYLLPLMFLKYVSENWLAMRIEYIQQFPAQPKQVANNMAQQRFVLPRVGLTGASHLAKTQGNRHQGKATYLASFQTLLERREDADIGRVIDCVLAAWEQANPIELRGIFSHVRFHVAQASEQAELRRKMWSMVLLELARFEIPSEVARNEYCRYWQMLLDDAPLTEEASLSSLMTRLLHFSSHYTQPSSIADPFCGNGELLQAALAQHPNCKFFGQDGDLARLAHARMGMLLHANSAVEMLTGNSLRQPKLIQDGQLRCFDWQVSNLARYLPHWDKRMAKQDVWQRFSRGLMPSGRSEMACICHMLASSTEQGRIVVAMRTASLLRKGKEKLLRKQLLEENLLDAVILLPAGIQGPRPLVITVFDRKRSADQTILMLDLRQYLKNTGLQLAQLEHIGQVFTQTECLPPFAARLRPQEMVNGDDWMPSSYVKTVLPVQAPLPVLAGIEQEIAQLREDFYTLEKSINAQISGILVL